MGRRPVAERQTHPRRETLSETRASLLSVLKKHGPSGAVGVAGRLRISREAARQQLTVLERSGWVRRRSEAAGRGRPPIVFELTESGEGLFTKNYDALSLTLVDAVAEQFGPQGLTRLLTALADQQVQRLEPRLQGKTLTERLSALKDLYFEKDPFTEVRKDRRGLALVEHNCPYLNLALHRPRLCSVTLSVLTRLLGARVVREERFQDGGGRCVFRVLAEQPVDPAFRFAYEGVTPAG